MVLVATRSGIEYFPLKMVVLRAFQMPQHVRGGMFLNFFGET